MPDLALAPIVEDSILFAHPNLQTVEIARATFNNLTEVCPCCGHAKANMVRLAKEIGVDRFVLIRFQQGVEPRLKNYLKIARWIVQKVGS